MSPEKNTTASVCRSETGPVPATENQLQLDYILPSASLGAPVDGGLFFPDHQAEPEDWTLACTASDHMLLWADLSL